MCREQEEHKKEKMARKKQNGKKKEREERGTAQWALGSDRKTSSHPSFKGSQLYMSLKSRTVRHLY